MSARNSENRLTQKVLDAVDGDTAHTVISFIPNTAEVAYYGLLDGFKKYYNEQSIKQIEALDHKPTHEELTHILGQAVRSEKVAWKDIKAPHVHHRGVNPQRPCGPCVRCDLRQHHAL